MSSEEMRAKAIEEMATAMACNMDNHHLSDLEYFRADATIAFQALGAAGFKVVGPGYTEEQLRAGLRYYSEPLAAYAAIVDAGDLAGKPA